MQLFQRGWQFCDWKHLTQFVLNLSAPKRVHGRAGEHSQGEDAMLRKGIVVLMMTVMSIGVHAADDTKPNTLMTFLKGPSIGRPHKAAPKKAGVAHAVVVDAATQVPEIRQTSGGPQAAQLQPVDTVPQPLPVQYDARRRPAPTLPVGFSSTHSTVPVHTVGHGYGIARGQMHHLPMVENTVPMGGGSSAALYPAPRGGIPPQVGGTAIVNQAFHPHEMLYPHQYKAMYGPYYYKVHGKWIVTPFGVWSHENWKLQGTQVEVKYKSHISKFAKFFPPVIR